MKKYAFSDRERPIRKIATLTTLSNGFLSVRGDPETAPSEYGTLVAGVYSYTPIFYRELVNLPRITPVYVELDGVPMLPVQGSNEFLLDAEGGTLSYKAILGSSLGELEYESLRLTHKKFKGIFALRYRLASRNAEGRLCIKHPIELDTLNVSSPPEVKVKLYKVEEVSAEGSSPSLSVRTADNAYRVLYALIVRGSPAEPKSYYTGKEVGSCYCVDVKPGSVVEGEKVVIVALSKEELEKFRGIATSESFGGLVSSHVGFWRGLWGRVGFRLYGDSALEDALVFNAFHLLQLYNEGGGEFMLPARGLHGYGYRGHVFWDSDTYSLPFYLLLEPEAARKILEYRCRCLGAAREYASSTGFRGARYPWEGVDDCREATPVEVPLDLEGSRKAFIETGRLEQHITADVAYAVDMYYEYTGDEEFMERCGLRIIFETARFWASRVELGGDGYYHIRGVIGPDEYHVGVDDSFYTNVMARYNLVLGAKYYALSQSKPGWLRVAVEEGVSREEAEGWLEVAGRVRVPCEPGGLCEEFEGYFKLKDLEVSNCFGDSCAKGLDVGSTRLVKQADVVAGLFLLRRFFDRRVLEGNYEYYLRRTTHASSLSLPMYAAMAAYLGRVEEALALLRKAASTDLEDTYGNLEDGFHVAAAAGSWMALLLGFLGLEPRGGKLVAEPRLPEGLGVELNVWFRGKLHRVEARGSEYRITEL
ncbi:glycoside hydrolase family 65 protein [Thermofilum pendens]|uniref:Kojibiose phosphorylase n=1 Tax=Thermofilum pendens (strain DSM 2475 / Hrk 5) TaxID=368408 RepID=A1RZC3_THEPD|nr:glycoside hydrolase family 65 protein [Thermofilum pendens]ABL78553.1 Kojibiose phosphorylase [Thermofilum pendens Hrk 5]